MLRKAARFQELLAPASLVASPSLGFRGNGQRRLACLISARDWYDESPDTIDAVKTRTAGVCRG